MPYFSKKTAGPQTSTVALSTSWNKPSRRPHRPLRRATQDMDLAPLLKGLPNDLCHCPLLGLQCFKGTQTVRYEGARGDLTVQANCFLTMTPGTRRGPARGQAPSWGVQFPRDLPDRNEAAMQRNAHSARLRERGAQRLNGQPPVLIGESGSGPSYLRCATVESDNEEV